MSRDQEYAGIVQICLDINTLRNTDTFRNKRGSVPRTNGIWELNIEFRYDYLKHTIISNTELFRVHVRERGWTWDSMMKGKLGRNQQRNLVDVTKKKLQ